MGKLVGIDLGTTYSAIAHVNKYGRPEIIPNREGDDITPSVVLFDEVPIVGRMAKNAATERSDDTVQWVKRNMGDPEWRGPRNGRQNTAEDVSAIILRRLKDDAEAYLNETIDRAVISVPAFFDDSRRKATIDAANIAGFEVLQIINEPTAGALAFGIDARSSGVTLVYDLGGGTFDVTIMRAGSDELEVISTLGARQLGGIEWDARLMEWLDDEFVRLGGITHLDNPKTEQVLREAAEQAKHALSMHVSTKVYLTVQGETKTIEVTREKFEELTVDLLAETERIMEMAREDAGIEWHSISRVLLIGGSTRMPAVVSLVQRLTGKSSPVEVHPDKAVALGAAIQANLLGGPDSVPVVNNAGKLVEFTIQDITAHSLGVAVLKPHTTPSPVSQINLMNSIVIAKGTRIPCKAKKTLTTLRPRQSSWQAKVTEGEDEDLDYVSIIGTSEIELPVYPDTFSFEVTYEYDRDGIIHVSVHDLTNGKYIGEMHITRVANMSSQEIAQKKRRLETVSPG